MADKEILSSILDPHRDARRNLFFISLGLSFLTHAAFVWIIQTQSLWVSSKTENPNPNTPWLSYIEKQEKDQILKEAFQPPSSSTIEASPKIEPRKELLPPELVLFSANEPIEWPEAVSLETLKEPLPFPINELLSCNHPLPSTFALPKQETRNLFDHLPKDLIVPAPSRPSPHLSFPPPLPLQTTPSIATMLPPIEDRAPSRALKDSENILIAYSLSEEALPPPNLAPTPLPNLPRLPSLAELETASCSSAFDLDITFAPNEEEEGYIFAVTLIPRPDLDLPKMKQHYFFLIDRSNSIQQERLSATKNAIHKVLGELSPDDTFNLIAFDSKTEKLSPHSLSPTPQSLARAEEFLNRMSLGSFFSQTDLYKPLLQTVPGIVEDDETYTAILITDGEHLAKKTDQKTLLYSWTAYSRGRVSLFSLGMKEDAHLSTLDTASVFNKGKLFFSPTKKGLKRKLLKLMKTIEAPVAKNLSCKAISWGLDSNIKLFPQTAQLPNLYLDQPYIILGKANTLDDFILFIQGRGKDRWINIRKTVSFMNGKKGGRPLKTEWALQKAYGLYEEYLLDDNAEHLAEARILLEPYDLQVAFE